MIFIEILGSPGYEGGADACPRMTLRSASCRSMEGPPAEPAVEASVEGREVSCASTSWEVPELLYVKVSKKEQTLRFASVLRVKKDLKYDFTRILVGN